MDKRVPLFFSAFCSMMIGSSVLRTTAGVSLAGVGANAAEMTTRFTAQLSGAGFANPSLVPAVDAQPKSEAGSQFQQVNFAASTGPEAKIKAIADAVQTSGSDGAIEAWKVRDLGFAYDRNEAVKIKIASFTEPTGTGKTRVYAVSVITLDKRYVLMARGVQETNSTLILALDESGTIRNGRWWQQTGNSNMPEATRRSVFETDTPKWADRFGVAQVVSTATGS